MKKFLSTLFCAVLAALTAAFFAACNDGNSPELVTLKAVPSAAEVIASDDVDYFVVPEPAASVRVKATAGSDNKLNLVGDLQELYGGDNGYPQAVIVAKKSILGSETEKFVNALKASIDWVKDDSTEISDIVAAVKNHLPDGTTPTFSDKNLNGQVISHCGINFTGAAEGKEEVKTFLTALKSVQADVNDEPSDAFFLQSYPEESNMPAEISVFAPDGAPALVLAGLMSGAVETTQVAQTINYNIVRAEEIGVHVNGQNPDADICILPVNVAAKSLGSGEKYVMLGTVTHGNLYILSAKSDKSITKDNISELKGKTVGVVNLAAVPGLTFKLILNKYGIEYSDGTQS